MNNKTTVNKNNTLKKVIVPGTIIETGKNQATVDSWKDLFTKELLSAHSILDIFASDNEDVKFMLRRFLDALYCAAHSEKFDFEAVKEDFDKFLDKLDSVEVAP